MAPQKIEDPPIRVLVVEDHPASREALKALLESCGGIQTAGMAADGAEALEAAARLSPDLVLMDCRLPGMDGIEAARRIKQRWPGLPILATSLYASLRSEALAAGADDFLVKGCEVTRLIRHIRRLCAH